jgi:hypothetical protein
MRRPPILGIALALVAGLAVGLLVLRSGAAPELTEAALADARQRWNTAGPASYRIELEMRGALSDHRQIEVRDGRVVAMTVDGRPASESAWRYWSVEGLFDSMAEELENARHPPPGLGIADGSQLVLRAAFDPGLGYPTRFLRHLLGRQCGTEREVVGFERLE